MYYQQPVQQTSLTSILDKTVAGNLIRQQLDRMGMGGVADYMQSKNRETNASAQDERPSVATNRRRSRPFTEMDPTVVEEQGANGANDLLMLTRQLDADTLQQNAINSELYLQYLQSQR